jgi:hypothetical protein
MSAPTVGADSRWYQAAQNHSHGQIRVGAVTRDVLLETHDTMPDSEIDAAYRKKYGPAAGALTASPAAHAASARLLRLRVPWRLDRHAVDEDDPLTGRRVGARRHPDLHAVPHPTNAAATSGGRGG